AEVQEHAVVAFAGAPEVAPPGRSGGAAQNTRLFLRVFVHAKNAVVVQSFQSFELIVPVVHLSSPCLHQPGRLLKTLVKKPLNTSSRRRADRLDGKTGSCPSAGALHRYRNRLSTANAQ